MLLLIDLQTSLMRVMPQSEALVARLTFVLEAARRLGMPIVATEQYPQGLGSTHEAFVPYLSAERPAKTSFSAHRLEALFAARIASSNQPIFVAGVETHICVLQTVLGLLEQGTPVQVLADAVCSRHRDTRPDHELALKRMEKAGATLTTVETAVFEWLGDARHPEFKALSKMLPG